MKLQRLGGYAAIASVLGAVAILLLINLLYRNLQPGMSSFSFYDPARFKDAVSTAPIGFYAVAILIVIHFSLLQIMFFTIHERMHNKAPQLTLISLILSSAGTAVLVAFGIFYFDNIRIALQHGVPEKIIEARWTFIANYEELRMAATHFYGWACLLTGWAILRVRPFSAVLGWLFIVAGPLNILGFMHIYFESAGHLCVYIAAAWIGIVMLRQKQHQPELEEMAVSR
jgi:hypothetical protein